MKGRVRGSMRSREICHVGHAVEQVPQRPTSAPIRCLPPDDERHNRRERGRLRCPPAKLPRGRRTKSSKPGIQLGVEDQMADGPARMAASGAAFPPCRRARMPPMPGPRAPQRPATHRRRRSVRPRHARSNIDALTPEPDDAPAELHRIVDLMQERRSRQHRCPCKTRLR